MTTFTVTFDDGRVGRERHVAPYVTSLGEDEKLDVLADRIEVYARRFLISRDVSVQMWADTNFADLTMTGGVYAGIRPVAAFTVTEAGE